MATAEQIKSLIRSHLSDDDELFYTLALQVAAHEAQQGHGELAHDIKGIVDKARQTRGTNALLKFPQELAGMVLSEKAETPASALVLLDPLKKRIQRIIHEHRLHPNMRTSSTASATSGPQSSNPSGKMLVFDFQVTDRSGLKSG